MITSLLIIIILIASLSSNIQSASSLAFNTSLTRLSSVAIIFSSFLIMNIFNIDILNNSFSFLSGFLNSNIINLFFQFLLLLISGFIISTVASNKYLSLSNSKLLITSRQSYLNNYVLIVLFNIIGACFLMNTGDTMMLYIAIELQSFSLYLLSTLKIDSVNSAQAGLRYFLIGSLASTLILLGIALLYYATGLTNFESLYLYLNITDLYSSGGFEGGLSNNSPYVESMDF